MLRDVFYFGEKPNVHPREKFAIDLADARNQCTTEHFWIINEFCNYTNFDWDFDFEFLPDEDVWAENHNNVWPSQHQKDSGTWLCPKQHSDIIIYRNDVDVVKRKNIKTSNWVFLDLIDENKFDFSWHPDATSPPYIYRWGSKFFPVEVKSVLEYHVPGATDIKYMTNFIELLPEYDRWVEVQEIDKDKFDLSWRPNPHEPPFIYIWGNKHIDGKLKSTLEYHVPGATQIKYMPEPISVIPEYDRWVEHTLIDKSKFDFTWRPDPREPDYIYVWGNKYEPVEIKPALEYRVPNATQIKCMTETVDVLPQWDRWDIIHSVDKSTFDFSWRPDPREPNFNYVFGNKYYDGTIMPTIVYKMENALGEKYISSTANLLPHPEKFQHFEDCEGIDYSWVPNPTSPPYIYVWGNQWNKPQDKISVQYVVEGATEYKYMEERVIRKPCKTNWEIDKDIDVSDFDFSWEPNPNSPSYIYQFGTLLDNKDGPRYVTPNNNGEIVYLQRVNIVKKLDSSLTINKYYVETTLDELIHQHPNETFWALNKNIDYSTFNFDWRPEIVNAQYELNYIHTFGSPDSPMTHTYFVNSKSYLAGNKDLKFVDSETLNQEYLSKLFVKPDMFFIDRSNKESQERFLKLKETYGDKIQKTRYLNTWVDTINRCINRSTTELCWILNSELDYANFDFNYYPNPWQMSMVHIFGTQYSHWGTTFMVNRETFSHDTRYIKIIEHLSNLNFVKKYRAIATNCLYDIVLIDHGNSEKNDVYTLLKNKVSNVNVSIVKFDNNYLKTFKNFIYTLPQKKEHYIWVCSSVCDYSKFDFAYISDPFAKDQLHVFPSQQQKYGDTFLIDVNKTIELLETLENLDDYVKINYNNYQRVPRLKPPVIITGDSNVDVIKNEYDFPYCVCITEDNKDIQVIDNEPISLWSIDKRNILITTNGGTRLIVPKDINEYVTKELYDYPYIKKSNKLIDSNALDIVFLSNGEKSSDQNYEHLLKITHGLKNRVVRVDGINGRVNAYHTAAYASNTPWFFTVFAKLKIDENFDFNWQPDRLQIPKHYIFYALNPVNGLTYGHQGMIAYNKKLVLNNNGLGLDFTLDDPHEVVELLSGVANYNTDQFSTWRTAFREVIKLRVENSFTSQNRIKLWLSEGTGDYREYSQRGARDALDYYDLVNGDFTKLKLSYEWEWLKNHYKSLDN